MSRLPIYGVDPQKAANFGDIQRDSRTLGQRVAAACRKPDVLGAACFALAGTVWLFPASADLGIAAVAVIALLGWRIEPVLPLKLPVTHPGVDPHELEPGTRKPRRARGAAFLGNDRASGAELYLSLEDFLTHFLFFGGTGAGKTEAMSGLAANTLLWGSGFTYVDGKGAADLWTKVLAMARACGREDDVYVLNYITGSADVDPDAPEGARLSNTFNPFLHGSADAITQLLVTQMADAGGDSATWKDKAIGLLTAYVRVMVAMRDRGRDERNRPFALDVGALRAYLPLDHLIDLYLRARERVDGFELPGPALEALRTYLESVPGFQDPARLLEQQRQTLSPDLIRARAYPPQADPQTYLQHGYLQNQFGRMFGQLADVYGHIFRVGQGEIDMADVVLQRRILVVMLPPLEKSPDELASLGKLLIGALKTMLAIGLGARLEGTHREVIDSRPTAAPSPYLGVFDEYGYYPVEGFAVVPAQARSLGFSICFGGQDIQSFGKQSQEEAAAIVANTLTKIGMFVEDPKDTTELFEKVGGQALAVQSSGLSKTDSTFFAGLYRDAANATYERRARIDPLDLRAQVTGEAHIVRGIDIVRAQLFYPGNFRMAAYRVNRFATPGEDDADDPQRASAPTPESVRAAVARAVADAPLDALQIAAMGALMEGAEPDDPLAAEDVSGGHAFARRLIERYLNGHAALDAEFAARLREAGSLPLGSEDAKTDPATAADCELPADRRAVESGAPSGEDALSDTPVTRTTTIAAAGADRGAAVGEDAPAGAGGADTGGVEVASAVDVRAAVLTVLNETSANAVAPAGKNEKAEIRRAFPAFDVAQCYQGGAVANDEPEDEGVHSTVSEPSLHRRDSTGHSSAHRSRDARPPVVVVDRLEDLAAEPSAFRADAWVVHRDVERT